MQEIILSERQLVPTKGECQLQVQKLYDRVSDGEINPLHALGLLTAIEKVASEAKALIIEEAVTEAEKYDDPKNISYMGCRYEKKEVGTKYDFTASAQWCDIQQMIDDLRATQKGIETEMKLNRRAAKSSKTSVVVTLQ